MESGLTLIQRLAADPSLEARVIALVQDESLSLAEVSQRLECKINEIRSWIKRERQHPRVPPLAIPRRRGGPTLIQRLAADPSLEARVIALVQDESLSLAEVSQRLECRINEINSWIRGERRRQRVPPINIPRRKAGRRQVEPLVKNTSYRQRWGDLASTFFRLVVDEGMSIREIGAKYGCSHEAVRLVMREAGYPPLATLIAESLNQRMAAFAGPYLDGIYFGMNPYEAAESAGLWYRDIAVIRRSLRSAEGQKKFPREYKLYCQTLRMRKEWSRRWNDARWSILAETNKAYSRIYGRSIAGVSVQVFGNVAKDMLTDAAHSWSVRPRNLAQVPRRSWGMISMLVPEMGDYPREKLDAEADVAEWLRETKGRLHEACVAAANGAERHDWLRGMSRRRFTAKVLNKLGQYVPLGLVSEAMLLPNRVLESIREGGDDRFVISPVVWKRWCEVVPVGKDGESDGDEFADAVMNSMVRDNVRKELWSRIDSELVRMYVGDRRDLIKTTTEAVDGGVSSAVMTRAVEDFAHGGEETAARQSIPTHWLWMLNALVNARAVASAQTV